jgi:hypothetical protein
MNEQVIPILHVADARAAAAWYERLGFRETFEHRFGPPFPAFVGVRRGALELFLSEHADDARPDGLVYLRLRELDAIAKEFGAHIHEEPWGRELALSDPDGNRLRISDAREGGELDR